MCCRYKQIKQIKYMLVFHTVMLKYKILPKGYTAKLQQMAEIFH